MHPIFFYFISQNRETGAHTCNLYSSSAYSAILSQKIHTPKSTDTTEPDIPVLVACRVVKVKCEDPCIGAVISIPSTVFLVCPAINPEKSGNSDPLSQSGEMLHIVKQDAPKAHYYFHTPPHEPHIYR